MNGEVCKITDGKIFSYSRSSDGFFYRVKLLGNVYEFRFCEGCYKEIDFNTYGHVIRSAMLKGKLPLINSEIIHWDSTDESKYSLKKELRSLIYPKIPKDKLENLFSELYKLQKYDGALIKLADVREALCGYNYFKNTVELDLYLKTLVHENLIEIFNGQFGHPEDAKFTFKGLSRYIELQEEGYSSNKCFIAMSFQSETIPARNAIKSALVKTGFEPIIIDEKNISSDRTINDEIIANLRKCKFCIADFTFHKNGVYFESGFALGQGKPVIYLCEKSQFENAHFDIKPLQHIIYTTPEELEDKLKAKIKAWIL